ncbi:LOW QUALITY PROTEIN: hypothetical protein QTO34_004812, partial [Cnephaeus nilssonii]
MDQCRVLVLEALVVSPEVGQALQLLFQLSGLALQGPALKSLQLQEGRPLCKALLTLCGALQLHLELCQPQRGLGQGLMKSLLLNKQLCIELPEASLLLFGFQLGFWVEGPLLSGGRAGFWADVHWLRLLPLCRPSPLLASSVVLPGGLWSLSLPGSTAQPEAGLMAGERSSGGRSLFRLRSSAKEGAASRQAKYLEDIFPEKCITFCFKFNSKEESSVTSDENNFENSKITGNLILTFKQNLSLLLKPTIITILHRYNYINFSDTHIPIIVCSQEDKEDLETGIQNVKDVNRDHDEHDRKELELRINQDLIRSTASRDEKNTFSQQIQSIFQIQVLEKKHIHDEVYSDFLKRTLSPSSSAESALKRDFYSNEKYFSGNEGSHQPSEEITSDMRKIKPSLGNTGSDDLVQLHISNKEVLDDNANPAQRRVGVQISCPSSDQLMEDNLNKKHEGGAVKIKMKDLECLRRDFHLEESIEKGSSKKDYGNGKNEEQRMHLGVNEKQSKNLQSILHDQEKISHSEISVKETGASSRGLTVLQSKDNSAPNQAIREDSFQSPRGTLSWGEAVLTTTEHDLSISKGTTSGEMPTQVCSPRNGNILKNDYLFQVEEENVDRINPEDQNKNKQHKKRWNFLESQGKARESKTNTTQQVKQHADCEDTWGERDNTRSLTATPTEKLFTCQETVSSELSSLADHDITEKAGAGTAYIIKTISESTLESTSAGEKAVIAKLPQETARSDRPIEVKETAFDPHEGRNDDSHYTFCQGDAVGVTYDDDFEKTSYLDVCNVHVDEMESDETISMHKPAKTHDRKKRGTGNITSVEESLQVISSNQKTASKLNLGMSPVDKKIFSENRDPGQVQGLSKERGTGAVIQSALNADTNRASENGSHVSNHHAKTSVSSYEQAIAVDNTGSPMTLQSIRTKSEYNCNPASEIQGIDKYPYAGDTTEEVSKSSGTVRSVGRRETHIGECNMKECVEPVVLITEAVENVAEVRHKNEGLLNSGQSPCFSGDKESESSASANLPAHESQAQSSQSLLLKYTNSKISYFLLFLIFLVTIYQYDLMIGLAFYLLSLYWLSWEGGRQKESEPLGMSDCQQSDILSAAVEAGEASATTAALASHGSTHSHKMVAQASLGWRLPSHPGSPKAQ